MTPMYTYMVGHRGVGVEKGQASEIGRGPERSASQTGEMVDGTWSLNLEVPPPLGEENNGER